MTLRSIRRFAAGLALAGASFSAQAALLVGLQPGTNTLVFVDSATPTRIVRTCTLVLPPPAPAIVGIDQRPATGEIYAISANAVYSIDTRTCGGQLRGSFATPLVGGVGVDFNPTVDRIRIVTDSEQNLRLNPDTGAIAGTDTALNPPGAVVAAAYDRNVAGATVTTLYVIDANGTLLRQGGVDGNPSPNTGTLTLIGSLGVVPADGNVAFEITSTGEAFATINVGGTTGLYAINLATGAATLIGTFASGAAVIGLAGSPGLDFAIPTMSTWGALALAAAIGLLGMLLVRRRQA